jgi:N-acylneuraminate cytidylyltransferase
LENGSIYIFKPWVLRQFNNRLGGKIALHRMSVLDSFQIDEPGDFELLEVLMQHRDALGNQTAESSLCPAPLTARLASIRLLVLDFDGVMTDNRVLVMEDGKEAVFCNRGDGLGLSMLGQKRIEVVVISKEKNPVVTARCRKLGMECVQDCNDKLSCLSALASSRNLSAAEIAYVGNDVNDLACLRWVGLPIAVADGAREVRSVAHYITRLPGGHGAVREVCDLLLQIV